MIGETLLLQIYRIKSNLEQCSTLNNSKPLNTWAKIFKILRLQEIPDVTIFFFFS